MFRLFWNVPAGPLRYKSSGQGLPRPPPRVLPGSPLPPIGHIGEAEAGKAVQLLVRTVRPPPLLYQQKDSLGENALLETALAPGTLPSIFPPYPCIGHYSPPSPSAASFQRASSTKPATQSSPWPSKEPCCQCLWWDAKRGPYFVYAFNP